MSSLAPPNRLQHTVDEFRHLDAILSTIGASTKDIHTYLMTLIDSNQAFVVTSPTDDQPIVYVSDAFCRMCGYEREEILGKNCRFLQGPETDDKHRQAIRRGIDEGVPVAVRMLNYRKDGTPFWNAFHITPKRDRETGRIECFLGIQIDASIAHNSEPTDARTIEPPVSSTPPPASSTSSPSNESFEFPPFHPMYHVPTIRVSNPLEEQLILWMQTCDSKQREYWRLTYDFRRKDTWLQIPSILVLALTSLFAATQATEGTLAETETQSPWFRYVQPYMIMGGAFCGSVLTGVSRYMKFGERSERCASTAKQYSAITTRIDATLDFYRTNASMEWDDAKLEAFAKEISAQIETAAQEATDIPQIRLRETTRLNRRGNLIQTKAPHFVYARGNEPKMVSESSHENIMSPITKRAKVWFSKLGHSGEPDGAV